MGIRITADGAVGFPGLNLGIEHLKEGIEIFGITISFSGILIALALFFGLFIVESLAKKTKQNAETYLDLAIQVVALSVLGSRIAYVIFHWGFYKEQPARMFALEQGGMSFMGALTTGLIVSYVYCRKRRISWLKTCDTALLGVVLGQIFGKVGDFFGRTNLGTFSEGKLAMLVEVADTEVQALAMARDSKMVRGDFLQVHPLFMYEILALLLLYAVIAIVYKKQKIYGIVLGTYLIGYSTINFLTEFIRLDVARLAGNISWEQFFSITTALFGFYVWFNCYQRQHTELKNLPKNFFTEEEE